MDLSEWLVSAAERLCGSDSPRRDAEILLSHVTGKGRTFLLAFGETELSQEHYQQVETLLARRINGEPVAYILGEREFWSLPLYVSPHTLIPRPDTECLVEQALARIPAGPCQILDAGTGTGAIALAIASERPDCQVTGVDLIPEAVELARRNAARSSISNAQFLQSNWFSAIKSVRFSLVVSNPPYIDESDEHLVQGDVRFEPRSALVAKDNGLADLAELVSQARGVLIPGGWLLLEHGWKQGEPVRALFSAAGYNNIETVKDYGNNDRLTLGRYGMPEE
ncbi:peptide chain release factor N(5)-glutamine methyltransferase [Mangrovibacter yixingensis]|uniref:peptide chain release factor N(5)-glutamine methyltransferase n=1 Tax=Mangrovibacter yixingensis TaxID=1529639 RepID=UPI001CFA7AC2|nr:peptide chain release factor N(5)-glutamine methyltransferase [Mangrovibacter yixingensis]